MELKEQTGNILQHHWLVFYKNFNIMKDKRINCSNQGKVKKVRTISMCDHR